MTNSTTLKCSTGNCYTYNVNYLRTSDPMSHIVQLLTEGGRCS